MVQDLNRGKWTGLADEARTSGQHDGTMEGTKKQLETSLNWCTFISVLRFFLHPRFKIRYP